jgi:hypothetical protein
MSVESEKAPVSSYRYLRLAMVGLLFALATAVFYQSILQGSLLESVSAYYYTPAQVVFVGALIGLGACMITLQGMNDAENTFLNLGGMFAIVVALIPTGLGSVFDAAAQACRKSAGAFLTQPTAKNQCPSALALENAARANVRNNMVTLLVVGGLVLIFAGLLLFKAREARKGRETKSGARGRVWVRAGFFAAGVVWLAGLIGLTASLDWVAANGHYIAGGGLLVCIVAVAGANAHRLKERPTNRFVPKAEVLTSPQEHLYTWAAIAMLVVSVVLIALWQLNVIALFWLEITVAFMFILFWLAQTLELAISDRKGDAQTD